MMRTPTDDAAWVARYQAATERLKTKEAVAKAGASAQEVAGLGDATWEPEPIEATPGGARLDVPGVGGLEPRSIVMTQATVEAVEAKTFIRDAGRADVEESREVVDASPDAGKEAEQPESQPVWEEPRPQSQQDQPKEQAAEAERGVVVPLPNVQAVAPTDKRPSPPQGSILAIIDLTIDDPPSDKGKQKANIKMVDAPDRPGTSVTSGDDVAEASARWPNFAGLVLARAEEELPR
jgi:hypothetical protein